MARIRPYESQVSAQGAFPTQSAQASDVGGPGLTQVGQSVQNLGQHMGQVQRIIQNNATRAAVTDVHTMLAGAKADYTKRALEFEAKADPKDTDLWDQFYSGGEVDQPAEGSMKWYLDSYREQITDGTALQAFDRGASDLTSQFGIHFAQVQSRMAGVHAKNQATQMLDHAQVTVQTDPGQYDAVMAATIRAIDDPASDYGRAGVEQKNAIKRMATEQISKSTMQGLINIAPEQALRQLTNNTHGLGLKGEDVEPLARSAETAIRAKDVEARRVEAEAVRQKKALHDTTDQSLGAKYALHEGNPGNSKFPPVTATEIGKLMQQDKLDGPTGRAWLNMIEADSKGGVTRSDPGTFSTLLENIYRPAGDPKKLTETTPILNAAVARRLTSSDFRFLREEYTKSRTDEGQTLGEDRAMFLKMWQPSIDTSILGQKLDQSGSIRFGQFSMFVKQQEDRMRKEGKNPHDLYDDRSPAYLGNQVTKYIKPLKVQIDDYVGGTRKAPGITKSPDGGVPTDKQRRPGETAEQYINRLRP